MSIAAQLGIFFPEVASAARGKIKEEKAKKRNGNGGQKLALAPVATQPATVTEAPVLVADDVVSRELLWQDDLAMFLVRIPSGVEYKVAPHGGDAYLRFLRPVKGGVVFVHVYHPTGNPGIFSGEKVACRARIWSKKIKNGLEYLYIDLFILPRETKVGRFPTHEWRVVQGRDPIMPKGMKNVHHFPTPEPLDGAIVVGEVLPKFK